MTASGVVAGPTTTRAAINASGDPGGGPYSPDPRDAPCVRHVRKGSHVWRDFGSGPVVCVYCGREKGRRYTARGGG